MITGNLAISETSQAAIKAAKTILRNEKGERINRLGQVIHETTGRFISTQAGQKRTRFAELQDRLLLRKIITTPEVKAAGIDSNPFDPKELAKADKHIKAQARRWNSRQDSLRAERSALREVRSALINDQKTRKPGVPVNLREEYKVEGRTIKFANGESMQIPKEVNAAKLLRSAFKIKGESGKSQFESRPLTISKVEGYIETLRRESKEISNRLDSIKATKQDLKAIKQGVTIPEGLRFADSATPEAVNRQLGNLNLERTGEFTVENGRLVPVGQDDHVLSGKYDPVEFTDDVDGNPYVQIGVQTPKGFIIPDEEIRIGDGDGTEVVKDFSTSPFKDAEIIPIRPSAAEEEGVEALSDADITDLIVKDTAEATEGGLSKAEVHSRFSEAEKTAYRQKLKAQMEIKPRKSGMNEELMAKQQGLDNNKIAQLNEEFLRGEASYRDMVHTVKQDGYNAMAEELKSKDDKFAGLNFFTHGSSENVVVPTSEEIAKSIEDGNALLERATFYRGVKGEKELLAKELKLKAGTQIETPQVAAKVETSEEEAVLDIQDLQDVEDVAPLAKVEEESVQELDKTLLQAEPPAIPTAKTVTPPTLSTERITQSKELSARLREENALEELNQDLLNEEVQATKTGSWVDNLNAKIEADRNQKPMPAETSWVDQANAEMLDRTHTWSKDLEARMEANRTQTVEPEEVQIEDADIIQEPSQELLSANVPEEKTGRLLDIFRRKPKPAIVTRDANQRVANLDD